MDIWCSMISYLSLSSGVYIPLYWVFVIKIFNIYCFFKPNWWMLKIWSPKHHWTVSSMKWISLSITSIPLIWGGYQGDFSLRNTWPRILCLVRFPHPWGKFSTFLQPFYNVPDWPGVLPPGQADDMCITLIPSTIVSLKLKSVSIDFFVFCHQVTTTCFQE